MRNCRGKHLNNSPLVFTVLSWKKQNLHSESKRLREISADNKGVCAAMPRLWNTDPTVGVDFSCRLSMLFRNILTLDISHFALSKFLATHSSQWTIISSSSHTCNAHNAKNALSNQEILYPKVRRMGWGRRAMTALIKEPLVRENFPLQHTIISIL